MLENPCTGYIDGTWWNLQSREKRGWLGRKDSAGTPKKRWTSDCHGLVFLPIHVQCLDPKILETGLVVLPPEVEEPLNYYYIGTPGSGPSSGHLTSLGVLGEGMERGTFVPWTWGTSQAMAHPKTFSTTRVMQYSFFFSPEVPQILLCQRSLGRSNSVGLCGLRQILRGFNSEPCHPVPLFVSSCTYTLDQESRQRRWF